MAIHNEYIPQSVSHPGETLNEKLLELGMSQKEFAMRTHQSKQDIVNVINGESPITPDMAVQFENVLKIPAHFWLTRQQNYDIAIASINQHDIIVTTENSTKYFPYKKFVNQVTNQSKTYFVKKS